MDGNDSLSVYFFTDSYCPLFLLVTPRRHVSILYQISKPMQGGSETHNSSAQSIVSIVLEFTFTDVSYSNYFFYLFKLIW